MTTPSDVPVYCGSLSPNELKLSILKELKSPVVFKGMIKSWFTSLTWTQEEVCSLLANVATTFKVCPKQNSPHYKAKFSQDQVVFETDCNHVEATFSDMQVWFDDGSSDIKTESEPKRLKHDSTLSNLYPRADYWLYADYKYMSQLCTEQQEMIGSVNWGVFGFNGRNGNQSTLWVGSEGASTPCHYDTYGCNLVAQLSGRKKWTLFPPSDAERLYPTRIPYEESSVFSSVNISNPKLQEHPLFKDASPHQVVLSPGDVLFVPFHWWHYVECVETAVSVNTWIDMPQDNIEKVKEAIVRTLVSTLAYEEPTILINPNEVVFSHQENMSLLNTVLQNKDLPQTPVLTTSDLVNIITSEQALKAMVDLIMSRQNRS